MPAHQHVGQGPGKRLLTGRTYSKDGADLMRHKGGIGQRAKLHEPNALGKALQSASRHLERQPSLPTATDPGESEQACVRQPPRDLSHLELPTDEAADRTGEVVA